MTKLFSLFCLLSLCYGQLSARELTPEDTIRNVGRPQLLFVNNDTVYDFGGIPLGAFIEYQFEIRNTGDAPLIITNVKSESGNIKCKWPGKLLKPGKKSFISVTYTANGEQGSFNNDIYITSNATESPYPFIHVSGAIIPAGG